MPTLYTNGAYTALSLAQFNSYSLIRYSAENDTSSVSLGLTTSGAIDFSSKLGTVSALIEGWTGNDNIVLGAGNDTVWGNSGDDTLTGGAGNDVLIGDWGTADRSGNDVIYGGDGNDELIGDRGNDTLYGGLGDDFFSFGYGAAGVDALFGGDGIDAVSIRDVFNVGGIVGTAAQFNRLVFNAAASIEYLLWDDQGVKITGTTGSDLFDFSGTKTLAWSDGSYIDRFELDLLTGNDTFIGGAGSEHLTIMGAGDKISLGAGNDTLTVLDSVLAGSAISAGDGYDTLELGGPYRDSQSIKTISLSILDSVASLGFERVVVGDQLELVGTNGADRRDLTGLDFSMSDFGWHPILLLDGDDSISGATGRFLADGGAGNDTLVAGAGNDSLIGGDGNDSLVGGDGNDTLSGDLGDDTMVGGEGGDLYVVNSALDVVVETGTSGFDTLWTSIRVARLADELEGLQVWRGGTVRATGNASDNLIIADYSKGGVLIGLAGNDTLQATSDAQATLRGGLGDDLYRTTSRFVVEITGGGIDTVETKSATYVLPTDVENLTGLYERGFQGKGNALNNVIVGSTGKDTLLGGYGNDSVYGGAGNDRLEGGKGNDSYWVEENDRIVEAADSGVDQVFAYSNYSLSFGVENLTLVGTVHQTVFDPYRLAIGNTQNNKIIGSDQVDHISGLEGNDWLNGGLGEDSLAGGYGNDTLRSDDGKDRLYGGAGDDLYIVMAPAGATDGAISVLFAANELSNDLGGADPGGKDTIRTNFAKAEMASAIENLIDVSNGDVSVLGNASANRIETGSGNDRLYGKFGSDTLDGGSGDDTYGIFVENWIPAMATIVGFRSGHDHLVLISNNGVSLHTNGALGAEQFKLLGKGQAVDEDDRVLYDQSTGTLSIDADGSGAIQARPIAHLQGNPALALEDISVLFGDWVV